LSNFEPSDLKLKQKTILEPEITAQNLLQV